MASKSSRPSGAMRGMRSRRKQRSQRHELSSPMQIDLSIDSPKAVDHTRPPCSATKAVFRKASSPRVFLPNSPQGAVLAPSVITKDMPQPMDKFVMERFPQSEMGILLCTIAEKLNFGPHVISGAFVLIDKLARQGHFWLSESDGIYLTMAALVISTKQLDDSRPGMMDIVAHVTHTSRKHLCYFESKLFRELGFPVLRREDVAPFAAITAKLTGTTMAPIYAKENVQSPHDPPTELNPDAPDAHFDEHFYTPRRVVEKRFFQRGAGSARAAGLLCSWPTLAEAYSREVVAG